MGQETYIGLFGRRNQGKSSLMNLLTGQQVSIVSEKPGTTTDPVKKSCEIFGIGKCVLVDTAGFDDEAGDVGRKRVEKTREMVPRLDAALLLVSGNTFTEEDKAFADYLQQNRVPFLVLHNKSDEVALTPSFRQGLQRLYPACKVLDFSVLEALEESPDSAVVSESLAEETRRHPVSSVKGMPKVEILSELPSEDTNGHSLAATEGTPNGKTVYEELVDALQGLLEQRGNHEPKPALAGLVQEGDVVVLVCPVDAEAPKGRLILPQVLMARQCLDLHAMPFLCQVEELPAILDKLAVPPALVITDSQAFHQVAGILPASMPLTSFSICLARQKGNFETYLQGATQLASLQDGDRILMLESCTHQVNCHDIGRFKLPAALRKRTGKTLDFLYISGLDPLPSRLEGFRMAIQCGGCMVGDRQLSVRVEKLAQAGLPVCNYGMTLAWCAGIFERAVSVFNTRIPGTTSLRSAS